MNIVQGGKGANQAVASARLGAKTRFITCVGNDDFGTEAINAYKNDGINTSYIKRSENPTGIALINIASDGENSISVIPGANSDLKADDLDDKLFEGLSYLIVQMEIPVQTITKAIDLANENGVKVVFNPAPARVLDDFPFHKVYLFTPNKIEAEFFTGVSIRSEMEAELAAIQLHDMGIKNVIITLGRKGAYCSYQSFRGLISGYTVKATDTTAAGDVFNGALAAGLVRYNDIHQAVSFAHGASALSVTKLGAQPSIPYLEEVLNFTNMK
jgi:ribokinase